MLILYNGLKETLLISTILVLCSYTASRQVTVNGNFQHCMLNGPKHNIELNSLCNDDGFLYQLSNENATNNCTDCDVTRAGKLNDSVVLPTAVVYIKRHNMIEGFGYNCSMVIHALIENYDIFGNMTHESAEVQKVTRENCLLMVENDYCSLEKMNCSGRDNCYFKGFWRNLNSNQPFYSTCSYSKIKIVGKTEDTTLFKDAQGKCTANELECKLDQSLIVWKKDIIRKCFFEPVLYIDDLRQPYKRYRNLLESRKNRFLFTLTGESELCGTMQIFKTQEGLYIRHLAEEDEQNKTMEYIKSSLSLEDLQDNDIREFMLAEEDFDKRNMLATVFRTACSSLINTIRSHIDAQDKFMVISEFGLKDAILYINDGLAYLPVCTNVSSIQVLDTTSACYRDVAVKYKVGDNEVNGFLRPSNILSQFSEIVDCKTNDKSLVIESSSVKIKRKRQVITIEQYDIHLATKLRIPLLQEGSLNEIFKHHQLLVNSTGTIDHIEELFASQEREDIFYVRGNERIGENTASEVYGPTLVFNNIYNYIKSVTSKVWNFIVYSIVAIVLALVLGFGLIKAFGYLRKNKSKLWNMRYRRANPNEIELLPIP
jgi:hypothetical protein